MPNICSFVVVICLNFAAISVVVVAHEGQANIEI